MAEPEKPQNDFFNDFMFGTRPKRETPEETTNQQQEVNQNNENDPTTELPPSQLEQLLLIIQFMAPMLDKLVPTFERFQKFIAKQKQEATVSKEKPRKKNTDK